MTLGNVTKGSVLLRGIQNGIVCTDIHGYIGKMLNALLFESLWIKLSAKLINVMQMKIIAITISTVY